jgi:hypothetical protein
MRSAAAASAWMRRQLEAAATPARTLEMRALTAASSTWPLDMRTLSAAPRRMRRDRVAPSPASGKRMPAPTSAPTASAKLAARAAPFKSAAAAPVKAPAARSETMRQRIGGKTSQRDTGRQRHPKKRIPFHIQKKGEGYFVRTALIFPMFGWSSPSSVREVDSQVR